MIGTLDEAKEKANTCKLDAKENLGSMTNPKKKHEVVADV